MPKKQNIISLSKSPHSNATPSTKLYTQFRTDETEQVVFHQFSNRNHTEMEALDRSLNDIERSLMGLQNQIFKNRQVDQTFETKLNFDFDRTYTSGLRHDITGNEILNQTLFNFNFADISTTKESIDLNQKDRNSRNIPILKADITRNSNVNSRDYSLPNYQRTSITPTRKPQPNQYQRKLKPCMILSVEFGDQFYDLEIYPQDNAQYVVQRILSQLKKTIDKQAHKYLIQIIQNTINKYCEELGQIIKNIQQKSYIMISQDFQELKTSEFLEDYIKQRNLINSQYKVRKGNALYEASHAIGKIIVDISGNKNATLYVHQDSDPYELAFQFILTHRIKKSKINLIVEQIVQIQKAWVEQLSSQTFRNILPESNNSNDGHAFKLNFEKGNGQTITIPVRMNDNLKKLAYNAAVKHKLDHEAYQKMLTLLEKSFNAHKEKKYKS